MTPQEWQRVEAALREVWQRAGEDRAALLDELLGDDPALRGKVEDLLDADGRDSTFLDGEAARQLAAEAVLHAERTFLDGLQGDAPATLPEVEPGPYRIQRELGRGGMGSVYLAVRADREFDKQVAIKIAHPSARRDNLVGRFRNERQILVQLDHPYISRFLDGGTLPDGRPYFVMEYVDGTPIDEHCRRHGLTVEQRLELFVKVCGAVQYAHRHLVVHRDIKPSNILVTAEGDPRLLDFGIAKILDAEAFAVTVEPTQHFQRPMTPRYASPEQILGEPITTAADVYSLGVLLYLLLTGRVPHDRWLPDDLVRSLETGFPAPSFAASDDRQLGQRLAGDLDVIVMTALRAAPKDRYGSAELLAEDIRRHLDGLPIRARQPTLGYRLGKLLRRRRLEAAFACTLVVLLGLFAASIQSQAEHIARQRGRAEQVKAFLVDLFEKADPNEARGEVITVKEVLDRGAEEVRGREDRDPEVRAALMIALGRAYRNLGLEDQAVSFFDEARRIGGELGDGERLESAR